MSDSGGNMYAAIGQAASSIGGTLANVFMSKANRKAIKKQNELNRQHQLDMWNMTNEYNTPLNQRMRMEEAGFNPNLMAGSPQNTAQNQNMPDGEPALIDSSSITQSGQALGETFQSILNNEATRTKLYADANRADAASSLSKEQEQQLKMNRGANIALRQHQVDSQILKNFAQDLRNTQMPIEHQAKMVESAQRIANLRTVMNKENIQSQLLKEELELRKMGINPNTDGFWTRILGQLLPQETYDNMRGYIRKGIHPMAR